MTSKTVTSSPASFPTRLSFDGSRYYRHASLARADVAERVSVGFKTVGQIAHWLLRVGPVRLRFRWHRGMNPDRAAVVIVTGEKQARATCLLVGYESETERFRLLTPFGAGFGEIGRVWIGWNDVRKLLEEGAAVDAPWMD